MVTTTGTPFNSNDPVTVLVNTIVKSFRPLYTTLIITCIWSAMLVPLSVVLLFFSNSELRRKPVFLGNVFALCLGFSVAGIVLGLDVTVLMNPLVPPGIPLCLTFATFMAFSPLLVESVLLIRLWAVYPFQTTPRKIFFGIFIPIALLKIGRAANAIVYVVKLSGRINDGENALLLLQQIWTTFPNYKIEWFLQVVDNTSASVLFLCKLNKGRVLNTRVPGRRLGSAIEALFWIAVSNFVIPVMLSTAELIVIWLSNDIFNVFPICIVNFYVEIIGVLLATVWASGTKWHDSQKLSGSGAPVLTTVGVDVGIDTSPTASSERKKRLLHV